MLVHWLQSGVMVDAILMLVGIELLALWAWRWITGRGPGALALLPNLLAGVCLLLALRAAVHGAAWPWMAAALAGAGIAHLADLRLRFQSPFGSSRQQPARPR